MHSDGRPIAGTKVNHDGPVVRRKVRGSLEPKNYSRDTLKALGMVPSKKDRIYLTAAQIVEYGVVWRGRSDPRVTVEEVRECASALGLQPHAVDGDDEPVYDPRPIRLALSTVKPANASKVWW
jgi:hypothetical protein